MVVCPPHDATAAHCHVPEPKQCPGEVLETSESQVSLLFTFSSLMVGETEHLFTYLRVSQSVSDKLCRMTGAWLPSRCVCWRPLCVSISKVWRCRRPGGDLLLCPCLPAAESGW